MRDNRLVCQGMYVDPDNIAWFQSHHIHDSALYAHALVQAMEWLESEYHIIHEFKVGATMLRTKADEIMRGFGYTEGDHGK